MSHAPLPITAISLIAPLRVTQLDGRKTKVIDLQPDAETRGRIAEAFGLSALKKFRFTARLAPFGKHDWELLGEIGATVVQPCAVTLEPVATRIDEPVQRRFLADMPQPEGLEIEMPEDDSLEPLGTQIDISAIALEALSLAIPAFPRAQPREGAAVIALDSRPPGAPPITAQETRPFAALEALKYRMQHPDPESDRQTTNQRDRDKN